MLQRFQSWIVTDEASTTLFRSLKRVPIGSDEIRSSDGIAVHPRDVIDAKAVQ